MSERLTVTQPAELFPFLTAELPGWHRNTLRARLRAGCVRVNDETTTRRDHPLLAGDRVDVVALDSGRTPTPSRRAGLRILFEDEHLVAIDKPAGLLSVSTDRQRDRTALALLRQALSRPGRPARLWPVHRLDRETSGVLLFARSRDTCERVRAEWEHVRKTYLAIVEGRPEPAAGRVEQPLWEDGALNVHVGKRSGAKDACSEYSTRSSSSRRSLLEVRLITGRRHQIRAHLAWLGHPVVGDVRYGGPASRMALHAQRLEVPHPIDERPLVFEAPTPTGFEKLMG